MVERLLLVDLADSSDGLTALHLATIGGAATWERLGEEVSECSSFGSVGWSVTGFL